MQSGFFSDALIVLSGTGATEKCSMFILHDEPFDEKAIARTVVECSSFYVLFITFYSQFHFE